MNKMNHIDMVNELKRVKDLMTSSNALKCVVSDYEKRSPQQKIGDFTQQKLSGWSQ
jgi:hypothetical protein